MKHITPYLIFESSAASPTPLTEEQVQWLNKCADGTWKINPQTGLVDVKGNFECFGQGLTDFKGVKFGVVSGSFNCADNQLTSLDGAPQKVGEHFSCRNNQLTSLEGSPQRVGWDFDCSNNQLTSLEGSPQRVGWDFDCGYNQLTSLEGAPLESGQDFYCGGNPVSEETLDRIFYRMKEGKSYIQAVESLWSDIPLEDRVLLYRPEFEWVSPEEIRKLEALKAYHGIKGMI